MNFILVFIGGGLGSLTRYCIGLLFQKSGLEFPVATMVANIAACLIFASCLSVIVNRELSKEALQLLLLTGFCGGLSTFSTFGFETWTLLKQNHYYWALINVLLSVSLCIGAFIVIIKK